MESLERKDATTGTEEPIKSEGMVPSPSTSERSNSASSPPPNCSICLGKLVNTSFTDSCLHQFCFTCLLQWSKIKTECPLCKQTFKSIIHNVRSEGDYDQYHVQYTSQVAATLDVTGDIHISGQWDVAVGVGVPVRPFMYRTTMGANNRRYGMLLNPEAVARREQLPAVAQQISSEERRRRNANPIDYRRTVYRHGIWAASLPDAFGRFRESSAEYYRRHPAEVHRLVPWLNRELQVLLNNNQPHIAYVMSVITDAVTQHDIHSAEFRNAVRPYFGIHTDHFVHEFSNFARTNFDLIGYDQTVTYLPNRGMYRGLTNEYVHRTISPTLSSSSSSSNDSDVRVLDDAFDPRRLSGSNIPSAGPHMIDMPGPSTVGQAFRLQLPMPYTVPDVLTISSTSSSSENECEVVGYVKPRHERTPEIIDLSSSESEEINVTTQSTPNDNIQLETSPMKEENMPSTSSSCANSTDTSSGRRTRRQAEDIVKVQMYEYLNSSSESDSDESDSDYNPQMNKKTRRHKTTTKKSPRKTQRSKTRNTRKSHKTVQRKREIIYSSGNSENESPQRITSTSRGTKRYLSKSSDGTESEKVTKKCKKSKKSKSSKKSKKRLPVEKYETSTSSSSSDSEEQKKSQHRIQKKQTKYRYSSEETRRSKYEDSNSSSESNDRLHIDEDADQHCTTDDEGSSAYSDDADFNPLSSKRKNIASTATNDDNEHSSSNKSTKSRHRSHKKRKESKKRRRSRS